jgi:hypothetical protein
MTVSIASGVTNVLSRRFQPEKAVRAKLAQARLDRIGCARIARIRSPSPRCVWAAVVQFGNLANWRQTNRTRITVLRPSHRIVCRCPRSFERSTVHFEEKVRGYSTESRYLTFFERPHPYNRPALVLSPSKFRNNGWQARWQKQFMGPP